jgi:YD repeat-containing protein
MSMKAIPIALVAATVLLATPALAGSTAQRDAPTTRFYDARGNSMGTATTNSSGTTTFYDARGNLVGHSTFNSGRR